MTRRGIPSPMASSIRLLRLRSPFEMLTIRLVAMIYKRRLIHKEAAGRPALHWKSACGPPPTERIDVRKPNHQLRSQVTPKGGMNIQISVPDDGIDEVDEIANELRIGAMRVISHLIAALSEKPHSPPMTSKGSSQHSRS